MALNDKLKHINTLKRELDAMQPMSHENDMNLWKKIRLDWDFNSNHIEGNTLTYGETMLLLIFDKTTGDHELREYEEMKAHDVAIHMVKDWAKDKTRDLTESDIRELNKAILVKPYWKEAITQDGQQTRRQIKVGEYKEHPNSVRLKTGEIFQYTSPLETPLKMAELMQWYKNNKETHPLVLASQLHYDFIRIHPFDDGNGRVARLLVNYVLMKNEYPPIIVKAADKDKYLTALNKADTGDINAFHEYMADQLIWSLELAIKAAKGESIEEPEDFEKELKQIAITLKNQKVEVVKRTPQLVFDLWKKSIRPLSHALYEKLIKFNSFFTEFEIHIMKDSAIYTVTKEMYEKRLYESITTANARDINIEYRWRGFKGGSAKNLFDIYSGLQINLDDFDYTINRERHFTDNNIIIKNLYSQQLTEIDIQKIVERIANNTLLNIKEQYKRVTGKEL
ncbi:MAG TPA: Fic family protein [Bacteroidia bacterium]|nr:Fic family protein [Bacteroidia bacterium]